MSTNDPTPRDDTLADEMFDDTPTREPAGAPADTATHAVTTAPAPAAPAATAPATAPADGPWLDGPAPFAIVLGLLGLLTAGAVLLSELTDVTFPWADLGPWTVVAAGLVVVLVGAIGLRSSRRSQG